MKVVIAEKPSVAREIARVLGANEKKDGYIEGNGYSVTWAIGHLVSLADPDKYGWEKWRREDLPMLPESFKLVVSSDGGIKKQFNIIKDLFARASVITVATDAGREGELIFRYIYTQSGCKKPFNRLWISSLTDQAIREGFKNLKPGSTYDRLYYAAKARSEADWLVGMNASRALTLSSNNGSVLSIGRVQTPVLYMICHRYLENINFKPEPYWTIAVSLEKDQKSFIATHPAIFKKEEEAALALSKVSSTARCTKAETKRVHEKAPLLFDLTSLQQETNKKFGFSAQQTLDLAQDLYEKYKLITYPRTGSRYLSDDIYPHIPSLLQNIARLPKFKKFADGLLASPISRLPINSSKVTDHHALLPTETDPSGMDLPDNHLMLYDMIVTRFLAAFSPPCEKDQTSLEFEAGILFKASGSLIIVPGWRGVETEAKEEDSLEEGEQRLPKVYQGDVLPVKNPQSLKKMTKPRPLLNEASLLKLMETAGKDMDDAELREAIKDTGIGTPATRASVIETIFKRGYIKRDKKKILPTPLGLQVYELVKDLRISKPELTASWEKGLNMIEKGEITYEVFMGKIKEYTANTVIDLSKNHTGGSSSSIGEFEGSPVSVGKGKYGSYVKHLDQYYNYGIKEKPVDKITLAMAIAAIEAKRAAPASSTNPKENSLLVKVGKYEIHNGQYGLYVSDGVTRAGLKKTITTEQASAYSAEQCKEIIKSYKEWKKKNAKAA